jgi:L-alanine-DL-glutamate epimerase-like enolase superfamily enzyme
MKIIDVNVIWLRVPKLNQACEWGEDAVIVKITTDEGITAMASQTVRLWS